MEIYKNQSYSFEERAIDLVSKMTLEEKVSQIGVALPAIPRLGLPGYHFTNESAHGLYSLNCINVNEYEVTSFPVCLAMSQSWDCEKLKAVLSAVSDEARAYANEKGETLNFFSPTINMGRDPRNGRSDENFGEDPVLSGKMAASYIQGLQGDDEKYLKAVATPKHYMMNSSENNRHSGSANTDIATLREYYGKVFEYAIKEGKAESIMTSYNRINGVPASANEMVLTTLLREEWGFDGFVVSDCGAVSDNYKNPMFCPDKTHLAHYYCKDEYEATAMALMVGVDNCCGSEYLKYAIPAIEKGMITEDIIDRAAIRGLVSRFRLGMFDNPEHVPYSKIGMDKVCSEYNQKLCVDMANDSIVLLKNDKNLLPLKKENLKKILVVGPNAKFRQLGGYSCGTTNRLIDTPVNIMALDGLKNYLAGTDIEIAYEKGWCPASDYNSSMTDIALPGIDIVGMWSEFMGGNVLAEELEIMNHVPSRYPKDDPDFAADNDVLFSRALEAAKCADVVVMVAGTDDCSASEEHDRDNLELPYGQNEKIKQMLAINSNTVVVLTTASVVVGDSLDEAHTLISACFAGEAQGTAITNVLFGEVNPNAKLTVTWYKNMEDLPHVNDYGIKKQDTAEKKARTYMYFDGEVRFPFGYGISYSTYEYRNMKIAKSELDANETLEVSVDVANAGSAAGKEIVELYVRKVDNQKLGNNKPFRQLKDFAKVALEAGETKTVTFKLPLSEIAFWSNFHNKMVVEEGEYAIEVGRSCEDIPCSEIISVSGKWDAPLYNVYTDFTKCVYNVGEQGKVKVSATLEDATHLCADEYPAAFTTSNPAVAMVDEKGIIHAVSAGVAEITTTIVYGGASMSRKHPVAVR